MASASGCDDEEEEGSEDDGKNVERASLLDNLPSSSCDAPSSLRSIPGRHKRDGGGAPGLLTGQRTRKWYAMALLAATTVFMMADQNLLAPNLTAVGDTFNFTKEERDVKLGGQLSLAFFLVGAPASLVIGYFSDTRNRILVFVAAVLIGEAPCLATYWVETYTQLLVLRALTGISVGGVLPLLYSLMGDYFSAEHRSYASALLATAAGVGVAIGQAIAGFVGPTYGWRLPFVIVSIPTMVLAVLVGCTVRDAQRGVAEDEIRDVLSDESASRVVYSEKIDCAKAMQIFANRTNLLVFAQGIPGCVPWGVIFAFFNDFLHEKGLSVEMATGVTLWFGVGAAIGNVAGGVLGQRLYNKNKRHLSYLMGVTTALGAAPMCFVINMKPSLLESDAGKAWATLSVFGSGVLTCITGANVRVLLLNVNVPEVRGTVFSIFNLSDDLGKGLGPFLVSFLIVLVGRVAAFNIAMLLWVVTGALLLLTSLSIVHDVDEMKQKLASVAFKLESQLSDVAHLEMPVSARV